MEKGKLIPIVIAAVLGIVVIYLIASKGIFNKIEKYTSFSYEYNHEVINKDDIAVNDMLVINGITFMVVGIEGNKIVINTSEVYDESGSTEVTVELNEKKEVCFKENDCVVFSLT